MHFRVLKNNKFLHWKLRRVRLHSNWKRCFYFSPKWFSYNWRDLSVLSSPHTMDVLSTEKEAESSLPWPSVLVYLNLISPISSAILFATAFTPDCFLSMYLFHKYLGRRTTTTVNRSGVVLLYCRIWKKIVLSVHKAEFPSSSLKIPYGTCREWRNNLGSPYAFLSQWNSSIHLVGYACLWQLQSCIIQYELISQHLNEIFVLLQTNGWSWWLSLLQTLATP